MSFRTFRVPVSYGASLFAEEIVPADPIRPGTPTVVLAHGWCLDRTSWHKIIAGVQHERPVRIVVYDQRGHGRSSMGQNHEPSVRILGDDLFEVIHATTPQGPLVVAGHSMGGMSIMAYAGLHHDHFSERVHGVVLASTACSLEGRNAIPLEGLLMAVASRAPGIPPRLFVPRIVQGRLLFGAGADKADIRHAIAQVKNTKLPTIGQFFYAIEKHNEAESLAHFVDVPTHIVAGGDDRLIPVPIAEALRDLIPDSRLMVLDDVGHMSTYEASDLIVESILTMLDTPLRKRLQRGG